ncbi:MAG TPA: thiolase family protein [Streptosporangiaceae bacterium]
MTRRREVAVVGWAHSDLVTDGDFDIAGSCEWAINAALESAGVSADQVDGLATYPRPGFAGARVDGVNAVGVATVLERMDFPAITWFCEAETGMVAASIVEAAHAIQSGTCDIVVVWRAMALAPGRYGVAAPGHAHGDAAFTTPYGATALLPWHALAYSRYRSIASGSEADLGRLVIDVHGAAARNSVAAYLKRPTSIEEYLTSPYVCDPLRRFDCDRPVAGSAAIVLAATSTRPANERLAIIAGAAQNVPAPTAHLHPVLGNQFARGRAVSDRLWKLTGESPSTISVAELYDGFAPTAFYWIEALGFCDRGQAGPWYTAADRKVPVNTSGGSLGEGRLHGLGHFIEGAKQVSGRAGERQIADCRTAAITIGSPLINGGAFVLRTD